MVSRTSHFRILAAGIVVSTFALSACAKKSPSKTTESQNEKPYCAKLPETLPSGIGTSGAANGFTIDPSVTAADPALLPTSSKIPSLARPIELERLAGNGLLTGDYVEVREGLCSVGDKQNTFGAYSDQNKFTYPHEDPRFAEGMAYYYGDRYRHASDRAGVLLPKEPVYVIANCTAGKDNAFFTTSTGTDGQTQNIVCLGYSATFQSQHATFADDGQVVMHELQHAQTGYAYSSTYSLNQLNYDEAGSINEAISDAVALMVSYEDVKSPFDIKNFSAWALGTLFGTSGDHSRGARRCPKYDPSYPTCGNFRAGAAGFSAAAGNVSFTYPDGLGWPYAGFYSGSGALRSAWSQSLSFQEIHQASVIFSGAVYETFEALLASRDVESARVLTLRSISRALQLADKPKLTDPSPVNMPGLFAGLVSAFQSLGATSAELGAIRQVGRDRGLLDLPQLGADWASYVGSRFREVKGSVTYDRTLTIGDQGYLYFDVRNRDALTAGAVKVDFKITTPNSPLKVITRSEDVDFPGAVSDHEAIAQYMKINGTGIVEAFKSTDPARNVPLQNTYFGTFTGAVDQNGDTAIDGAGIAIEIPKLDGQGSAAQPGIVEAELTLTPVNGPAVTLPIRLEVVAP